MPRTKKYVKRKKAYRKKRMIKRSKLNQSLIVANFPNGNPLPRRYRCKLRYSDTYTYSAFIAQDKVFRLNSVHDPDLTGAGHQPRYYDQLTAIYSYYRVLGCRIRVRALPNDATANQQNIWVATVASNSPTSLTGIAYYDVGELPFTRSEITNLYGARAIYSSYHNVNTIAGVSKLTVMNSQSYRAAVGANPTESVYWHVVAGTFDATNTVNCRILIDLEYYVQFEDPLTPTIS